MSANAFAVRPSLPEPFPNVPDVWTCPVTGMRVPKDPAKNLQFRAKLLREAENDEALQRALYTACSQSVLFFVNAFVFTFRVFEGQTDAENLGRIRQARHADIPMVTWDIQDKHILEIQSAIDGSRSLLTDKTRDMGASWNHIAVIHHQFLFRPNSLFLELSRVETDVDGADNPRCLFVKHDYINKWLPAWMLPQIKRTSMHIVNLDNGSRIDGESSNKAAGSGDRRRAVLLDEMAKMENARKIKASLRDVSPCLLPNSTPWGAGTAYTEWRMSGQIDVFILPWWEHPEKGAGRYVAQDEATGKFKIRSPWYNYQETIRSPKEMAQEVDMDHIGSGAMFFEVMIVEEHKRLFGREAKTSRTIDFRPNVAADAIKTILARKQISALQVQRRGPWRLWTSLIGNRPDQSRNYIMGCDISKGQGASNSTCTVIDAGTREVVAEFADANIPPYDFARLVAAAAVWFGGASHAGVPFLIWEMNGPGWDFGRIMVKTYGYPAYFIDHVVGTREENRGSRYGWHASQDKKETMLGVLRRAYATGGIINHSLEGLNEATQYVYYEGGGIGPAGLMEESAEAKKTHGDRVISCALACYALEEVSPGKRQAQAPPARSFAWRREQKRRQATRRRELTQPGARWDWSTDAS